MPKKATPKQCMDFANHLLTEQKQVDALRKAGLSTGNPNTDYNKASRMVRFAKVQEVLSECQELAKQQLDITQVSVVNQYLILLEEPDITVKDKIVIWDKVAGLLGLNKIITENTNNDLVSVSPELAELLSQIKNRHDERQRDN
jgi:hypothetical protein